MLQKLQIAIKQFKSTLYVNFKLVYCFIQRDERNHEAIKRQNLNK